MTVEKTYKIAQKYIQIFVIPNYLARAHFVIHILAYRHSSFGYIYIYTHTHTNGKWLILEA